MSAMTDVLSWERVARAGMHPLAIRILECLARESECPDDTLSPKELAYELGEPLGNVSYHVRMLVGRDLIELARTETRRGAIGHWYRLASGVVA